MIDPLKIDDPGDRPDVGLTPTHIRITAWRMRFNKIPPFYDRPRVAPDRCPYCRAAVLVHSPGPEMYYPFDFAVSQVGGCIPAIMPHVCVPGGLDKITAAMRARGANAGRFLLAILDEIAPPRGRYLQADPVVGDLIEAWNPGGDGGPAVSLEPAGEEGGEE